MKKASIKVEEKIKLVDFVIILLDSRIPLSSKSDLLESITKNKKKLYVLTKVDLSDSDMTEKWIRELKTSGDDAIALDLTDNNSKKELINKCTEFSSSKKEKYLQKGIKNVTTRAMVLGIPNVGKSTLINLFVNIFLFLTNWIQYTC